MSYNTRHTRQTGQGIGVGRGTSQVMYHQQQQRPGGGVPAATQPRIQPNPPSQNTQQSHGYTSQHSQQPIQALSGSGGYSAQQGSQGYSTQSQQSSATPPSQGYSTQQYQTQQQQQQQQQQQSVPRTEPPAPKPPAPPATAPVAAPPPAPLKMEVEAGSEAGGEGAETKQPRVWIKKRLPGFVVNKKLKRRRQNARLRKILQPKNAIMVLNELKTGIKFTFQEHTNALTQTVFVVNAEVDGKTHVGKGMSKPVAKQNAAENALKALLLEKMAEAAMKAASTTETGGDVTEPMQQDSNNGPASTAETASNDGSEAGTEGGTRPSVPEDDVPWGSLASFALYKLFTDWQSHGAHVPIPKQTSAPAPNQPVKTGAPAPMKKIPDNPTDRHPVMLLNQLRPGVQFSEISREGTPPNLTFTLGVSVDGKPYTGVAKNKKDAKKEAAKAALAGALSIFYD